MNCESVERRIEGLERQLRQARRCLLAIVAIPVLGCLLAADGLLPDFVCRSLQVKSQDGKVVTTTLHENGDVDVGGSLKVKGVDLAAALDRRMAAQPAGSQIGYDSVYSIVSVGIANPPGNDHILLISGGADKRTLTPVFGSGVIATWCERLNNLGSTLGFEVTAEAQGKRVVFHAKDNGGPGVRNAAFRIHVLYAK